MLALLSDPVAPGGLLTLRGEGQPKLFIRSAADLETLEPWLQAQVQAGRHVCGLIDYEAGALLEPALPTQPTAPGRPLMAFFACLPGPLPAAAPAPAWSLADLDLQPRISPQDYHRALQRSLSAIRNGELYQVNYSFRCDLRLPCPPLDFFLDLHRRHPAPHAAYLDFGERQILSLSPELLLERRGASLRSLPMKGTAARLPDAEDDARTTALLRRDPKSRAENVMIVDLMRNDLARIAIPFSVEVPRLFDVESYRTLHQMTSTVTATLRPGTSFLQILAAVFPAGSITGAPKIQAARLIRELEPDPRGAYTGSILHLRPHGDFTLNVAIRTLECRADRAVLGIGSGIVADSDPAAEWDECLLKASFLAPPPQPGSIFSTLPCHQGRPALLLAHLRRLRRSCRRFGFPWPGQALFMALRLALRPSPGSSPPAYARLRLSVKADGSPAATLSPLDAAPDWGTDPSFIIAAARVDPGNTLQYHKTDLRAHYDQTLAQARSRGASEALFLNTRGELAEGCISNVALLLHGRWLTPPLASGCLDGIARAQALRAGWLHEAALTQADLDSATALMFGNHLRGWSRFRQLPG